MLFRSNDTATTEIYTSLHTLSLHDALPFSVGPATAYEVDNFSVGAAVANLAANPSYGITATVDINRTLKVLAGASLIPA